MTGMPEPVRACPHALEGAIYRSCPRVFHGFAVEPCEGCPEATVRTTGRPATRAALDRLLTAHPDAEIAWAESQREEVVAVRWQPPFKFVAQTNPGPWTCVDLYEGGRILRFAIWNETGDVYALDEHGAVEDEPYLRARRPSARP